ncbi:metalloregulator ArsR/SmtB family transcription factor [Pleurocapsales cyanobacterium LEGE 10410]|nr:metalloregulator ArsR/SmtB family transcription factor [Pleurocapsales cyanobacterium LEGE 10410]
MVELNFDTLLSFFKVLANENRLKLVGILSQTECSVEDLAARLQLKEPTVSHHLNKLKELNLVAMRSQGNTHLYRLNSDTLSELNKSLFSPEQMASWSKNTRPEAWEEKVLQNYLRSDRVTELPASRKKRQVILRWLVSKFDPARTYSEQEVNKIIGIYYDDYATVRREFIGYQLMKRDNGIYQCLSADNWQSETEINQQMAVIPRRYVR